MRVVVANLAAIQAPKAEWFSRGAEGSVAPVANDFEIPEDAINQAIAFEERLRTGAAVED